VALPLDFTPTAQRDLDEIAFESDMKFGFAATDEYKAGLKATFSQLRDFPLSGEPIEFGERTLRRIRFKSHLIYYSIDGSRILVLRVLHGSQLPQLHL
jgi:plasmid stabilization system protein ParE